MTESAELADELGVARVFVKDESSRLGLPSFKALGAFWAAYRALAERESGRVEPPTLVGARRHAQRLGPVRFYTATDGNHGRAVARIAALLGVDAHIFVPDSVSERAVAAIAGEGPTLSVRSRPYDDTVAEAAEAAASDPEALLLQDTSWPGYEQVARWIVEGYSTLFAEIDEQLRDAGAPEPGLVSVPIGVGSLAQAAVMHYRACTRTRRPGLLGVEPAAAPCVTMSLLAGRATSVATGPTAMAGLNCGTPSSLAWPYLKGGLDASVTVTEGSTSVAVDRLVALGLSAGPSGAASLAGARAVLAGPDAASRRALLGLTSDTVVVLLSTEGRDAA